MSTPETTWTHANPASRHTVSFVLRPSPAAEAIGQQLLSGTYDISSASPQSLAADPADEESVLDFIKQHKLQVVSQDGASRTIHASGTVAELEAAFGVSLGSQPGDEQMHSREPLVMPAALDGAVIAVLGLDQRPVARRHQTG